MKTYSTINFSLAFKKGDAVDERKCHDLAMKKIALFRRELKALCVNANVDEQATEFGREWVYFNGSECYGVVSLCDPNYSDEKPEYKVGRFYFIEDTEDEK